MALQDIVIECYAILLRKFRPGIDAFNRQGRALVMLLQKLVDVDDTLTDLDRIFIISLLQIIGLELILVDYQSSRRLSV
jgi:hypothetical protein